MKTAVVLLALFAVALCEQSVPIPPSVDGVLVGYPNATFQIDAFIDLMCSDCMADWDTMRSVSSDVIKYGVSFRFHVFPLPYHTWAFLFAQGANWFITNTSPEDTLKYFDLAYKIQPNYYNSVVANLSANQITSNLIAAVAAEFPHLTQGQLTTAFTDMDYNVAARTSWKLACTLGMTGTPSFKANGVTIDGADGFTYSDWITFLKQYVSIPDAKELIIANKFKTNKLPKFAKIRKTN